MLLSDHVPCFVHLDQFDCQVWYAGQPHQCLIYLSSGHRAPACPFSSLYRRCRKPGHIARECTQAWCPSVSAPATDTSYEPSASSDRVMTDASPAVFVFASGSDPAAPVSVTFTAPVSVPTAPVSFAAPLPVSAAPAPVDAAPTTVPVVATPPPAAPQVPAVASTNANLLPLQQFSGDAEIAKKKLRD